MDIANKINHAIQKNKTGLLKSYARTVGKSLSPNQKEILEDGMRKHEYNIDNFKDAAIGKKIILEIGFGMGEHLLNLMQHKDSDEYLFLGCEVYLNGVIRVISTCKKLNLTNYMLHTGGFDELINILPDNSLDKLYMLFPDPWPKRKQQKKRLFNAFRLDAIKSKLKDNANLFFASDIDDYFAQVVNIIKKDENFKLDENFSDPHKYYINTKYHNKAIAENRIPQFLKCSLKKTLP